MRRALVRIGLGLLAGLLLILVGLHLALPWLMRVELERALAPRPGQQTYLGDIDLNLFTGLLVIDDVLLGDPRHPYFRAAHLLLDLDMPALWHGHLRVRELRLARGEWRLARRVDGRIETGFPLPDSDADTGSGLPPLRIDSARLSNFRLRYRDPTSGLPEQRLEVQTLSLRDFDPASRSAAPLHLAARWGQTRIALHGRLTLSPGALLRGRLRLHRLPLGKLLRLARARTPLSGRVDVKLRLRATSRKLALKGALEAQGLRYAGELAPAGGGALGLTLKGLALPALRLDLELRTKRLALSATDARLDGLRLDWGDRHLGLDHGQWLAPGLQWAPEATDGAVLRGRDLQLTGLTADAGARHLTVAALQERGEWRLPVARRVLSQRGLALAVSGLTLNDGTRRLILAQGHLQLQAGAVSFDQPRLRGSVELENLQATSNTRGKIASLAALNLLDGDWRDGVLALRQLTLTQLRIRQGPLRLQRAVLGPSELSAGRLWLGPLRLRGLYAGLRHDRQGRWMLPLPGGLVGAGHTENKATPAGEPLRVRLASLELSGDNRLRLVDAGFQPPLDRELRIERLRLGALDSSRPRQKTPLDLRLRLDRYSELALKARLRPFARPLAIDLSGELKDLHLPLVNGLVARDLGHRFLDGDLSDDFELHIARHRLRMRNKLLVEGMEVEAIPKRKGPPLSLAVALLEDRQGRIRLDVPIDGDLSRPDFHVLGALDPIIMKAVAGAAALAIQPLGSVLLVGGLLANQVLQVRFDPVLFEVHEARLRPGTRKTLEQLGKRLADRPKLRLRLCGVAVSADREQAAVQGKGQEKDGKKAAEQAAAAQLRLAEQRASRVRQSLIAAGVAARQLRRCRPRIDSSTKARPRVEIRL
jgi:hypothetical protein